MSEIPSGSKLDLLVLWAIGVLDREGDIWPTEIINEVASKVGLDPHDPTFDRDQRNLSRSLRRLSDAGLIVLDTGDGYHLARERRE